MPGPRFSSPNVNQNGRAQSAGLTRESSRLGITDLERFLRACVANAAIMAGKGGPDQQKLKIKYTVDEAADLVGVSPRWLADECRAERVEHVHLARHRFFTHEQILRMLERHVVKPVRDEALEPRVARIMRRIQNDRA